MVACGVFVAAEFSFVTVDRATVERAAAAGDAGAQGIQSALRTLSTQLSGAQLGITLTNLAIGFLAEPAIADLIDEPLRRLGVPDGAVAPIAFAHRADASAPWSRWSSASWCPRTSRSPCRWRPRVPPSASSAPSPGQCAARSGCSTARPTRSCAGSGIEPQEELRSARSSAELASLVQRSADEGTLDPRPPS